MTTTPQPASRPERIATAIGIALLATGAATLLLPIGFDLRGFGGGFVQGVGIGAMLVGTYLWGVGNGTRRARRRQWLPSRGTVE